MRFEDLGLAANCKDLTAPGNVRQGYVTCMSLSTETSHAESENPLLEQDLRRSFAEHLVAAIVLLQHSAHGLPNRVEGVDLEQLLFWDVVADGLVVFVQVEAESQ